MFAIMITHFAFGSEEQHIKVSVITWIRKFGWLQEMPKFVNVLWDMNLNTQK